MEFSSSEYAKRIHGIAAGAPPPVDLPAEKRLIECLVRLAGESAVNSAHDISDGGLAVTLAECCFASNGFSAQVKLEGNEPVEYALFGERGARAVVSCAPASLARVEAIARECEVGARQIGIVGRGEFRIQHNSQRVIAAPVPALHDAWANGLERSLKG